MIIKDAIKNNGFFFKKGLGLKEKLYICIKEFRIKAGFFLFYIKIKKENHGQSILHYKRRIEKTCC